MVLKRRLWFDSGAVVSASVSSELNLSFELVGIGCCCAAVVRSTPWRLTPFSSFSIPSSLERCSRCNRDSLRRSLRSRGMLLVGVGLRVEVQAPVPRDAVLVIFFWPLNELRGKGEESTRA